MGDRDMPLLTEFPQKRYLPESSDSAVNEIKLISTFDEAIACCNEQRAGLGFESADEVKGALARIKNYPEAWTPLSEHVRCCQVHRFPYSMIYEVRGDLVIIAAIQHHRRKPESWRTRLKLVQNPER